MPLEKLDAPTRIKLRSTQILTSLPQIISELVQNSLDASATNVEIGVDCNEWMCWVKDNGSGITKDGLLLLGRGSEDGRYGMANYSKIVSMPSILQEPPNHTTSTYRIPSPPSGFVEKVSIRGPLLAMRQ